MLQWMTRSHMHVTHTYTYTHIHTHTQITSNKSTMLGVELSRYFGMLTSLVLFIAIHTICSSNNLNYMINNKTITYSNVVLLIETQ